MDFKQIERTEDAIHLIEKIKRITFDFWDQKYVPWSIWNAYRNIFKHQQREEADAQVYLEHFNDLIKVLKIMVVILVKIPFFVSMMNYLRLYMKLRKQKHLTQQMQKNISNNNF